MNTSEKAIQDALSVVRSEITQFFAMRAEIDEKICDRRAQLTVLQNTAQAAHLADQAAAYAAAPGEQRQQTADDLLGVNLEDAPH